MLLCCHWANVPFNACCVFNSNYAFLVITMYSRNKGLCRRKHKTEHFTYWWNNNNLALFNIFSFFVEDANNCCTMQRKVFIYDSTQCILLIWTLFIRNNNITVNNILIWGFYHYTHISTSKRRICFLLSLFIFHCHSCSWFWEYHFVLYRFHLNSSHLLHIFFSQHFGSISLLSFILDLFIFF